MQERVYQLKQEAARWGLVLTVKPGSPPLYRLGYAGSTGQFESPRLSAIRDLLARHKDALSGHRQDAA